MFTIQQALDEYFSGYIGSYGGSQAGSGMWGVDGAGVISTYADGKVFSDNGAVTQTLPDGTQHIRVIEDGKRNELIKFPDGSVTLIQGGGQTIEYETRWADGRVTRRTYDGHLEFATERFPGGLTIWEFRNHKNGVYKREEHNAEGKLLREVFDKPGEYRKEYKNNEDGSWSKQYSYYKYDKVIGAIRYKFHKKNDAEIVKPGDYLNYDYESFQGSDGSKDIKETTSYYTGVISNHTMEASIGVAVARSRSTELPDGQVVSEKTEWWDMTYRWVEHPNVYVPLPPTPYGYLDATKDLLEAVGEAIIKALPGRPDRPGSGNDRQITLENGTVSLSIEAHIGTSGNDQIQGMGFLYGGDGNDGLYGSDLRGDLLVGGNGYDCVSYIAAVGGVTASLSDASRNAGAAANDIYVDVEGILGSSYNDPT